MSETNWAGNVTYGAARLHRPATLDELRRIVAAARRLRVLGARHSFNAIADSDDLVTLAGLPTDVRVERAAGTVTVAGAMTYGALATALRPAGLALHNMASLPHISIAGAVATATHGSGDTSGNLATAVTALELLTSGGELVTVERGDPDFDGLVVALGAAGVVTRLTLDVEPAYEVRQRVFEQLAWERLHEHFDAVTAAGDSVSVLTRFGECVDAVWVKRRVTGAPEDVEPDLFGARASTADRHLIAGLDPAATTPQLGRPGLWSDRLPHFRMGYTPSSGAELQSEYLVPRAHALPAIDAVRALGDRITPLVQGCEIRTIAADGLWMSPQYGVDTVGLHFTWRPEPDAVARVLAALEDALAPFSARPHWGKLFLGCAGPLYPRRDDFAALIARYDPRGVFVNPWLSRYVFG